MNILIATDNNFVQHCCVTLTSVLMNNTNVVVYLFTDDLTEENEGLLKTQVEQLGGQLKVCRVDGSIVSRFPMPMGDAYAHISVATYYRLFVEELLPSEVDKILYLDCDMVIIGSLEELYQTDVSGYALGAVYQYNEWSEANGGFDRLGIDKESGYFNAGMLLINLDYWRKYDVSNRLMLFIKEHYDKIRSHDQDVLNAVLYKEVLPVNYKWNFTPTFLNMSNYSFQPRLNYVEGETPVIIHFVSRPKPWQYYCNHPYKSQYYKYLSHTPFRGWEPKKNIKDYIEYCIRPIFIQYKHQLKLFLLRMVRS